MLEFYALKLHQNARQLEIFSGIPSDTPLSAAGASSGWRRWDGQGRIGELGGDGAGAGKEWREEGKIRVGEWEKLAQTAHWGETSPDNIDRMRNLLKRCSMYFFF